MTQVNDFDIEVTPAGHMVFFTYVDRPGIIGTVGTMLGEHDVNIATMDVGRKAEGGDALMCLTVDTEVPAEVLERVASEIEARTQLRSYAPIRHVLIGRGRVLHSLDHEADVPDDRRARPVRRRAPSRRHRAASSAEPRQVRPAPPRKESAS